MHYRSISRIIGLYLYAFTAALLVPLLLAIYYQFFADGHSQPHSTDAFFMAILFSLALAFFFHMMGWKSPQRLYRREGIAIVVSIWLLTPAISALPFWLSGTLKNPVGAYFEAVSGLTTAGSTVMQAKEYVSGKEVPISKKVFGALETTYTFYGTIEPVRDPTTGKILHTGIEAVGKALLFWRSFLQWLGGGGIVVLFVAVLPALGVGGKILFHTEMAGPIKESLTPRIKETAFHLWGCYLGFTILQIFLLVLTNSKMGWFDSFTITFSSISTGGFSVRNESIASYHNPATELIVMLFMILGSLNFSLYYYILRGKFYRLYEPEFLLFLTILIVASLFATWQLLGGMSLFEALRYGSFQIVSSLTTTGFTTANYDKWPYVVQVLMLILMFVGGMSGSTAGGIKTMRHLMLFKIGRHKVESLFQPNSVRAIKIGNREVDVGVAQMVLCFFLIVVAVSVVGIFLYVLDGIDPETALGLVSSMVNGSGLSFRAAGPIDSCAFLSDFGLLLSSLLMILGRLEYFAVIALLIPAFWKD